MKKSFLSKYKFFTTIIAVILLQSDIIYSTPSQAVIVSPYNNTGYTYNVRPWIIFYANDGAHQINDAQVQVATDPSFTNIVYDRKASPNYNAEFFPLPANSGAYIRHRIQTNLSAGSNYYVRVKVWCANTVNRTSSPEWSNSVYIRILAVPSFETITDGVTLVSASHFTELRTMIANVRQFRKNTSTTWGETITAGSTLIKIGHLTEMRTVLDDAYNIDVGNPGNTQKYMGSMPNYTPASAGGLIRGIHIRELRTFVQRP